MDDFKSALVGELTSADMRHSFEKLLIQAKEIRKQLGERKALLDRYLSCLLESARSAYADVASEDGVETAQILRFICTDIILGKERFINYPFYQNAKSYIESHPIDCEDTLTKGALYAIALTHDYLEAEGNRFLHEQDQQLKSSLDRVDLKELYRQICDIIGGEAGMKTLDRLFRQRFLIITSLAGFLQGMAGDLMFELTYRDRETSKQVFQLLLYDT